MEVETSGVQAVDGANGSMPDRPICITSHSTVGDVHELETDPGAVATDALSQSWNQTRGYAFPPFSLIGRCLNKVRRERVPELVLIAPVRQTQPWFPVLASMLIGVPIQILAMMDLLTSHRGEQHPLISKGSPHG